jgi:hypothetical protein
VTSRRRRMLPDLSPPHDQLKQVPCCVSCAITKGMEAIDAARGSSIRLSPMYNYYFSRPNRTGWPWLTFHDGFRSATQDGVASLAAYPATFMKSQFDSNVPQSARNDAQRHKVHVKNPSIGDRGYWKLARSDRVNEWKSTIDQGWPVLLGMRVSEDYRRLDHDHRDPLPTATLPVGGSPLTNARHAIAILGYQENDEGSAFRVSDSRGSRFGEDGRWWLPYQLVITSLVIEAWTLRYITYGADD